MAGSSSAIRSTQCAGFPCHTCARYSIASLYCSVTRAPTRQVTARCTAANAQVKLKPSIKVASVVLTAALRLKKGAARSQPQPQPQSQPQPQPQPESQPQPAGEPTKPTPPMDPAVNARPEASQTQSAPPVEARGQNEHTVTRPAAEPGVRKHSRGSVGLAACCGAPRTDRPLPARAPSAVFRTQQDGGAESAVDMDYKRQHVDRSVTDDDRQCAPSRGGAQNVSVAAPPVGGSSAPVPRTRSSSTPPRMTRAGLAARMEQARALSPRRTESGLRSSTPPRSGTPPRRKIITSDELGTKIQALRA